MRSRSDGNQSLIVDVLRKVGVQVEIQSTQGVGYDLLCRIPGRVFIVEVKPEEVIGKKGKPLARSWKFTKKEERLQREWQQDYHIVTTPGEALELVSRYRR